MHRRDDRRGDGGTTLPPTVATIGGVSRFRVPG
jgi:hypothetical protein